MDIAGIRPMPDKTPDLKQKLKEFRPDCHRMVMVLMAVMWNESVIDLMQSSLAQMIQKQPTRYAI
jgi:hypothetical protein